MDLAVITAQQVAELFILIGLGALGAKTGLLRPEGKQTLSNLLVNLVVPAMIINSYRMEFSAEILHNLMAAFALSTLSILLGLIITLLFTARSRDSRTPIFRFACVFSNAGYMGLPLISALFGSEGLLYASAFFTMFNLLLWTVGYSMVSGSSDPKKVAQSLLHCPAIYAIVVGLAIYLLQIPLPDLIVQPMELLGNMNTPPLHAHHRYAHRLGRPAPHPHRSAHLEAHRGPNAFHSGADHRSFRRAGVLPLRHGHAGHRAAGMLPGCIHHLGVRRPVPPR